MYIRNLIEEHEDYARTQLLIARSTHNYAEILWWEHQVDYWAGLREKLLDEDENKQE